MSDENPELRSWIEPELEARVVAWVLGEASDFEASELARIIGEKPELGVFKRRIEAVHGLVAAASRLEGEPMRMAQERRGKLLESLGVEKSQGGAAVVAMPREKAGGRWSIGWRVAGGIAACLLALAFLLSISGRASNKGRLLNGAATKEAEQAQLAAASAASDAQTVEMPPAGEAIAQATPRSSASESDLDALQPASPPVIRSGPVAAPATAAPVTEGLVNAGPAAPEADLAEKKTPSEPHDLELADRGQDSSRRGGAFGGFFGRALSREDAAPPHDEQAQERNHMAGNLTNELAGSNTYTGATSVSGGTLSSSDGAAGGAARSPVDATTADAAPAAPAAPPASTVEEGKDKIAALSAAGAKADLPAAMAGRAGGAQLFAHAAGFASTPSPIPAPQAEVSAADQPYSTFSLHVSDVSFLLARAALARGEMPDRASIRAEEFYNAFDYGDPAPATGEKIACHIEQAAHPLLQQRNLVRIAMKVAATGRGAGQPLRLTVLLDTSGSMEREDRAASVRRAMEVLTSLLGRNDAVTLIGFARQPRLLAEEIPGNQAAKLVEIVRRTPPEGGTNMEEALKLAAELALRHFEPGGQNRVVMLTDGAANLGDANPDQLSKLVERLRQKGVSFDACGVGADGLNDDVLEALTRKGGGRYYFLNRPEDADQGFARQLAGAFRPAAENVKMQVRFNPARVGNYKLIGFEKHRLNQEDFRNDKVTAAQLAAEEAAVALYQVQVLPEGEGEVGEVFVRFRDPADGRMVEQSWTIPYDAQAPALDKAPPSMQLVATAALVAEKLRGGPAGDAVDLNALAPVVGRLRGAYPEQERVRQLVGMFEQVRRMTGSQQGDDK